MTTIKKLTLTALMAAVTMGAAACSTPAPAAARESFVFGFNTGNVAFAYSDGYWDRSHHWHSWRSPRESYEFRMQYSDRYDHHRHGHYRDAGWRDFDHDGVPNRFDRRPDNPYRY